MYHTSRMSNRCLVQEPSAQIRALRNPWGYSCLQVERATRSRNLALSLALMASVGCAANNGGDGGSTKVWRRDRPASTGSFSRTNLAVASSIRIGAPSCFVIASKREPKFTTGPSTPTFACSGAPIFPAIARPCAMPMPTRKPASGCSLTSRTSSSFRAMASAALHAESGPSDAAIGQPQNANAASP